LFAKRDNLFMTKPIYVLGTALSHDGSSCILKNGKILVAIEKERLSKKKHDGFNDNLTIQYCLNAANITWKDITLIIEENTTNSLLKPEEIIKRGNRIIPKEIPILGISHHLAHAYSAVGTSPFSEMGVIVMDGQGSSLDSCIDVTNIQVLPQNIRSLTKEERYLYWEKESYYIYRNGKLTPVFKDFSKYIKWNRHEYPLAPFDMEHSIAEFFGGVSYYVFDEEFCEGKLMGLAPFGRPGRFNFDVFQYQNGCVFLNYEWMKEIDPLLGGKYQSFYEYFQYYADLAYFAQTQIEKAIFYLFNAYHSLAPQENVGYAGGLALNAVANAKLFKNTPFKNFYFQPAAGDSGLAIGCAYYGWLEVLKQEKIKHNQSTYFGRMYNDFEIQTVLQEFRNHLTIVRSENYIYDTATYLADGKVVAWYQNGSEFGPRALGNRSILADPRRKEIKNLINRKIKFREDFRPFAPSVIQEDVGCYFNCDYESPYMILVAQTKTAWKDYLPGIVHKDGSARIQTVNRKLNPKYYALLKEFKKLTNISILLNTSLNGHSMPIIETPREVVLFFLNVAALDILIIDRYILKKKKDLNQGGLKCAKDSYVVTTE